MATEAKTKPTAISAADFIAAVPDPRRRADAEALCALIEEATGLAPVMWGPTIVGFGAYHYRYDSGHEGDAALVGFSPRKANLVLYMTMGDDREGMLARLGKHRSGAGCIYVNRLSDVDASVIAEMAQASVAFLKARYPG
ncbi:MAG: hypothetical protein JWR59_414 [Brevundimonas sp.]|nr:hypothetical protein [Brevundimonas sp.]